MSQLTAVDISDSDRFELAWSPRSFASAQNALKLKTCPFCGGTMAPRWSPWLDGAPCWEIEHTDFKRAVAAKCPIEMGGYDSLEQLQQAGDYLSLRAGNHLVCRGRTYALPFICHLQMSRLHRRD